MLLFIADLFLLYIMQFIACLPGQAALSGHGFPTSSEPQLFRSLIASYGENKSNPKNSKHTYTLSICHETSHDGGLCKKLKSVYPQ